MTRHYAASVATLEDKVVQRLSSGCSTPSMRRTSGFSLRVPAGAQPAPALRAGRRDLTEASVLGAGRGYPRLLRQPCSPLADDSRHLIADDRILR